MRRVSRADWQPQYLSSPEVQHNRAVVLAHLRRPQQDREQRRDGLNEKIFYHPQLRDALRHAFDGKCAFCESLVESNGVAVHFRPLRFASNGHRDADKDYYLWLAFEWDNLLYCCPECAKFKGDLFPVNGARANFMAPLGQTRDQEDPLLLDPSFDEPARHLRFLWSGSVLGLSARGKATIAILQLNRPTLREQRSTVFSRLLEPLLSGSVPSKFESLVENLARAEVSHAGAIQNLLKRVSTTWLPSASTRTQRGNRFVQGFLSALRRADSAQLALLAAAARAIQQLDVSSEPLHSEPWIAPVRPLLVADTRRPPPMRQYELASINISNFKALESLELELGANRASTSGAPSMMILGENSTGKSSVLSAIALALIGRKESAKLRGQLKNLVRSTSHDRFDQLDELPVEVRLRFHFTEQESLFRYDPRTHRVEGPEHPSTVVLGYGPRRFFDRKVRAHREGGFSRVKTLFDPLATIPYPLDWLRSQTGSRLNTIFAALRIVLALDDDDELIFNREQLSVRSNGRVTPIDALSEGYRSVFVMTVDIIRELLNHWNNIELAQAVVLIDELETHLHPRWKMRVMSSLRRVLPRVQFIATTHDPLCLRGMDDGEVAVLQREDGQRICRIEGLPNINGMTAEQLLTSDYFGLSSTVDPSTELQLARLASDAVRYAPTGGVEVNAAPATNELVARLTVGDSPSEQVVQEAIRRFLAQREARTGLALPQLREEAVSAVLSALKQGT